MKLKGVGVETWKYQTVGAEQENKRTAKESTKLVISYRQLIMICFATITESSQDSFEKQIQLSPVLIL